MATRKMTLESVYTEAKARYAADGHDESSWQWQDEGKIYAIQDYLSLCGELDNADWEFARREGIEDECNYEIDKMEED